MKYINEYSKIMEELSDYLQEFFDKHVIMDHKDGRDRNMSWYVSPVDKKIHIVNIPYNKYNLLKEDLEKIIPNIEKRIGYKMQMVYSYFNIPVLQNISIDVKL